MQRVTTRDRNETLRAQDFLYPRLVKLIELIDESAAITYPRTLHRRHLTRLLVFLIGLSGSVTSRDLIFATGYEKAQISRGLKGLAEADLLDRPEARGSIRLSAAGQDLFAQIMVIARQRDASLREGIAEAEIERFLRMTTVLIERASSLVPVDEDEGDAAAGQGRETDAPYPRTSISAPSVHDLILPALRSLMVYVRRSGTSLFRGELGLSSLEWRVLSLIAVTRPINLSTLIPLAARDKSQVARAVKQLHAAGLLNRHDEGRVNVTLELTSDGLACHGRIREIGRRHDGLVFVGCGADDYAFYMAVIDRLVTNAAAMLAAEKADAAEAGLDTSERPDGAAEADIKVLREENARLRQQLADAVAELTVLRGG